MDSAATTPTLVSMPQALEEQHRLVKAADRFAKKLEDHTIVIARNEDTTDKFFLFSSSCLKANRFMDCARSVISLLLESNNSQINVLSENRCESLVTALDIYLECSKQNLKNAISTAKKIAKAINIRLEE